MRLALLVKFYKKSSLLSFTHLNLEVIIGASKSHLSEESFYLMDA